VAGGDRRGESFVDLPNSQRSPIEANIVRRILGNGGDGRRARYGGAKTS
jgi:hypothetical protein